jgi:hypothetical protein
MVLNKMSKITWMCAECAQDFTRRPTAVRHNTNLHDGKGRLVRFVDYIIGRITGEYPAANPLLFRSAKKKPQKPFGFDKSNNKDNLMRLTASIADADGDDPRCGNAAKPVIESTTAKEDHYPFDPFSQIKRKEEDVKRDSFDTLLQVSPKLAEVKILLRAHFTAEKVQSIIDLWHVHILTSGKTKGFYNYVDWIQKFVKLKEAMS